MELKKNFYYPFIAFLIFFIALFIVLGYYNWPLSSDDFNTAFRVPRSNFWEFQKNFFLYENGRSSTIFLISILMLLFKIESFYRFLALFTISTYAICVWIFIEFFTPPPATRKNNFLITLIITASTLACNYSLKETLYWMPGAQYIWGTSLFLLAMALAIKALQGSKAAFFGGVFIVFFNCMINEPACVFQGIVAFIATLVFASRRDKKSALICFVLWLISIAAFGLLYYSAASIGRITHAVPTTFHAFIPHLKRTLLIGIVQGFLTTIKFFATPLIYIFLLFLPLIAKKIPAPKSNIKFWQLVLIIYLLSVLMQMLHAFSLGGRSSLRVEAMTLWFMFFSWCCLLSLFYRGKLTNSEKFLNFARRWRYVFLILALLISFNFRDAIQDLKIAPAYRAENESRTQSIIAQRDAGIEDVTVNFLENRPKFLYSDFSLIPEDKYIANYYGVKSILAIPKKLSDDVEAIKELRQGHLAPLVSLAEAGDTEFLYELGIHSEPFLQHSINAATNLKHGLEVSLEQAEKYYRLGASAGDINCMWTLARVIYTKDNRSLKSIFEALYWMIKYQINNMRL